jgi:hypothetical protein
VSEKHLDRERRLDWEAEDSFKTACSHAGVIASPPARDNWGWDFFLQFPITEEKALEAWSGRRTAYVQIKSTIVDKPRAKVKLSNMREACNSSTPWFIFTMTENGQYFGKHVLGDILSSALEQIHLANATHEDLRGSFMYIPFAEEDQVDRENIVPWMKSKMGINAEAYSAEKKKQFSTAGYEDRLGIGTIKFLNETSESVTQNLLGLGEGLSIESFSFRDMRFGIPGSEATAGPGRIYFNPTPIDTCEVKVRPASRKLSVLLAGKVFGFRPPQAAFTPIRYSAPPVEVVSGAKNSKVVVGLPKDQKESFEVFRTYSKIASWMAESGIHVELRRNGHTVQQTFFSNPEKAHNIISFAEIIEALSKLVEFCPLHDLSFTVRELENNFMSLYKVALLLATEPTLLETDVDNLPASKIDTMLYHLDVSVGVNTFAAVVERKVLSDRVRKGSRKIKVSKPIIHDAWVRKAASASELASLQSSLFEIGEELGQSLEVLIIPDMLDRL